jgi:type I restriction enzyme S subunit
MTWKRVKLKELLSQPVQNGYSPVCPKTPNGKWILGLGALNGYGLDFTQIKPAPIDDERVDGYLLRSGDFLISRSNTLDKVGRSALFKGEIENCSYPDLMMRFRVDSTSVYPEYLEMYLRSSEVVRHFQHSALGTSGSMKKINKSTVENLQIPLPTIVEQVAIADLLSTWDLAIKKTERLIEVKEKRFKWLLRKLIIEESRRGKWRRVKLGEILSERIETHRNDLPLLSITREEGVIPRHDVNRKDTSNEDKTKYLRICAGDIGYNTMRMWQGVSALSLLEGIVSPAYTICTPSKDVYGEFMAYLFKAPYMVYQFYRYSQGIMDPENRTAERANLRYN